MGFFVVDGETSVLVDAGGPLSLIGAEQMPHGGRVNIGLHGATAEASMTPTNSADSVLTAVTASDGGRMEGSVDLYWVASGPVTGHTVRLEYSPDAGTDLDDGCCWRECRRWVLHLELDTTWIYVQCPGPHGKSSAKSMEVSWM